MKRGLYFLAVILLAGLPARAELGLALAPMRVELQIAPGGQYTDSLRLTNDSEEAVRIHGELLDWYMDDTITPQFAERYDQEKTDSCRDWLQVNPREMDLDSSASFRVRYTLRVPAGTPAGEYHCGAGFITMPPVNPDQPAMGMHIAVRAVTAIYVAVGNPSSQPVFKDLSLRSVDGGWEGVARFENQGQRHYRIQGYMQIEDASGRVIEKVDYPQAPVLGLRTQAFPLKFKTTLEPGNYVLRSLTDVGLPEALEASARVVVEDTARKKK
jgi:P pilus assembly chaperone PapD